jgi:hypothetical protein
MMTPLMDVDRAQVTRQSDGSVVVDDPGAPVAVALAVDTTGGRTRLVRLTVEVREAALRLSSATLARLPVSQLVHLAAAACGGGRHPDEPYYRQLARPKPRGQRGWDTGHWDRVLAVHEWAESVGRDGGGAQAVADFWGVSKDPTVYRWLVAARAR